MKRTICFLSLILSMCVTALAQDKFDTEQLKLRSDIESFLKEEGFMPQLDSDGDLKFKREGDIYYIVIDNRDHSPFYVAFSKYFSYGEKFTRQKISGNLDKLNMKKGVKTIIFDSSYAIQAQIYLTSAEHFKYVFYKLLKQLDALETEINDICSNTSGDTGLHSYGRAGSGGTMLVNENFSTASQAWRHNDSGQLSFKDGKMVFKDKGNSGYSELYYDLPRNIVDEDFEVDLSLKVTFTTKYSTIFFHLGTSWDKGHRLGFTKWGSDDEPIILCFGTSEDGTKYYNYSGESNLSHLTYHNYKIIKKGQRVNLYADNKLITSTIIDLTHDIKLMTFLVPNRQQIEVDSISLKLL